MSNNTSSANDTFDDPAMEPYPTWAVVILWILTMVFCLETTLGNLLVLMAYKLERNIRRQLSNKFIVSLAISDLIIGMEGFPFLTVYVVDLERWSLGVAMCQIWLCIDYTLCLVSILTVLLITVDRYCSVCYPAKYRMWQTCTKIRIMIVLSWIVPFGLFGLMIFGWEAMTMETIDDPEKCYAPFLNDPYVNMSMYIAYYWTTLVAMSVLYRGIHKAARTLEEKSKAKEKQTMALLLGQRCMAQVGVGIFMRAESRVEMEDHREESAFRTRSEYTAEYTELVHDSGYITAGNTTTTTTTTGTGGTHQSGTKEVLEEESEDDSKSITPEAVRKRSEDDAKSIPQEIVRKAALAQHVELQDFDEEKILDLPSPDSFKDLTPTQTEQPLFLSLSRGSSSHSRNSSRKYHKRIRLKQQDSGCSLELYDSSSCAGSLFGDSSITSVLDFEGILPMLDFIEEVSLLDAPLFLDNCEDAASDSTIKAPDSNCSTVPPDIVEPSCLDCTEPPRQFPNNLPITNINSVAMKNQPTDTNDEMMTDQQDRVSEAKLSVTSPSSSMFGGQTHLTVPKQSVLNRQRNQSTKGTRNLKDDEWTQYRESWQSTLSYEDKEKLNLVASNSQQLEDDEDSVGSKPEAASSGEDSSSEKRSGSWVATLFTNPTWLLHRRRKVTKAEQRARKAFRTITVIVGTFALFWSPYYIVATVYGFCPKCVPTALFFTSYYLCYLNSSMNPFAYAFANRLFRKTFVRILRGDFRRT